MACIQGFTRQEDCDMCGACITYGINPCAKGLSDDAVGLNLDMKL